MRIELGAKRRLRRPRSRTITGSSESADEKFGLRATYRDECLGFRLYCSLQVQSSEQHGTIDTGGVDAKE